MIVTGVTFDTDVLQADLILVDFWAPWCSPCRALAPIIEKVGKKYKVAKVDVQTYPSLATRFHVDSIPTLLVFKNGKIVQKVVGLTSEQVIMSAMKAAESTPDETSHA